MVGGAMLFLFQAEKMMMRDLSFFGRPHGRVHENKRVQATEVAQHVFWPEKKKTTLLRTLVIPTTQHVTMLELRRCDYFARWRQRARDCFIFSKEKDR